MIRRALRALVRLALEVFFGELDVLNRDRVPREGPLILCANHPNAAMDALLLGAVFGHRVNYLAKATLFRSAPLGTLLRYLGAIPVHRASDDPGAQAPGERNAVAFAAARSVLARGGWLAIFPEGRSVAGQRLQPLKTGAARIALEAEAENGFRLGVRLVPMGLAYSAPATFRSSVAIAVGLPIEVAGYREAHERDPSAAVRALTDAVDEGIRGELAYVPEDSLANLAAGIEAIYESEGLIEPVAAARLAARDRIKRAVLHFAEQDPARVEAACEAVGEYRQKLAYLRLEDRVVAARVRPPRQGLAGLLASLALGAPVALYGLANHLLAYYVPRVLLRLLSPHPTDVSSVKLGIGAAALLASYAAQMYAFARLAADSRLALAYALSLPLTGLFTLHYARRLDLAADALALLRWIASRRRRTLLRQLASERDSIVVTLEAARAEMEAAEGLPPT